MIMPWFIPLAVSVGILGTRTGLEQRHLAKRTHHSQGWWMTVIFAWIPSVCWVLAQFVQQY
jgi:hypothetical protein